MALKNSLDRFSSTEEFDLLSELKNDPYVLSLGEKPKSTLGDIVMNCPSLLSKTLRDYNDEKTFYYASMKDISVNIQPDVHIDPTPFCDIGVTIPGSRMISTKISDTKHKFHSAANTPKLALDNIIKFAKRIKNSNQVTVLLADEFTQNPVKTTEKNNENANLASASHNDIWSKWIEICKPSEGWWTLIPPTKAKNIEIPDDWNVFSEGEFLRSGELLHDVMKGVTPLLNEAVCNSCGDSVSGLLAANFAYSAKEEKQWCQSCGKGSYVPQYSMPGAKENVEVTLLEKIVQSIWRSEALIVIGSVAKKHPWVDLLDVAVCKNIPIGIFGPCYPANIPRDIVFPIGTDPVQSFSHFMKERNFTSTPQNEYLFHE
eukprot:CAMPEP_0117062262 /NCGR_PEP_ID=MMETSP0472-20121206/43373_1 /TAXON_ID=693140 ORGANISM="Tiarina fusus, Strain LIS" /NCGR_SAMPLE_ID=MMETSP0472 /ASSEMBLY_ACC=CAM_ASM_000603 /LENGTH=372 /DNA_ID=CAMNT_0004781317 /DNA_START=477 /DNA_END=1595 /DNA_ORIENTATION=+